MITKENFKNETMELNEIKKRLYKTVSYAHFQYIHNETVYYKLELRDITVNFEVPVNDMGTARFDPQMVSKHLIRWIKL